MLCIMLYMVCHVWSDSVNVLDCKMLVIPVAAHESSAVLYLIVNGMWWNLSWNKSRLQEELVNTRWVDFIDVISLWW